MADTPRVTIGVTAYNNERYLPGALDAVLAQDFADFEVVVCDNQSTDATWEICQAYADKDSRFRVFRNPRNLGVAGNLRRVLELAQGEYFRWTSHDDLIAPTLLSRCVEALDGNPRAVLAYPRGLVIDDDGSELFACENEPDIRDRTPMRRVASAMGTLEYCNPQFGLIRTEVLRRTRLIGQFAASDNRLLVELAVRGEFHLVPERLFFRRAHQQSSFGGERTLRQRYEWLEPDVAKRRTLRLRSGKEVPRITIETIKALLRNELPVQTRLTATAMYCVVWPTRIARTQLGLWRRQLTRRSIAAPASSQRAGE